MSTAQWQAFTRTVENAWERLNDPESHTISSGGGRNAHYCITRVADLLDDTLLDEQERLGEAFGSLLPGLRPQFLRRVPACGMRNARRPGAATGSRPRNPARSFSHARSPSP